MSIAGKMVQVTIHQASVGGLPERCSCNDDLAAVCHVKGEQPTEMSPSISLLWTLDFFRRDQAVLRPEEDTESIRKMNPRAFGDALGCTLGNKVNLMQWAPNAQDIML